MQSKPRSSAACAQSRILAGSVPMSRVGKRALSNIDYSCAVRYGSDIISALNGVERNSMRLQQPDPATALLGLRAMKTLATTEGPMRPTQRALLEAAKKVILRIDADLD